MLSPVLLLVQNLTTKIMEENNLTIKRGELGSE